ncbi:MAG: type II toxin-antitoxin system RelE/ParE family toxin [Ignavibacteriae bacterium]|nr:type II toxin-antitoxin system RelE/ParE family toxin [Ignavibacteriota bacterium]
MDWEIKDKELIKLYETGKSKKFRIQKYVLEKFFIRIQQIEAANTIHDLWQTSSLKFKYLESEKIYSMRIDGKYRLEIEVEWENDEKTIGKFNIINLSNHYED